MAKHVIFDPGICIGGYRLDGLIARGGMGAVYKAVQLSLNRLVALKVLHPERIGKPEAIKQFLKEARVAASLSHSRLMQIYDVGYDEALGVYFYSMQLAMARTLTTLVKQNGPQPWETALYFLEQIADGLAHAHAKGLVHRDLKPDNILVDKNGGVLVADLGLALDQMAGKRTGGRRILKLVGTPEFSAPEQLRDPDRAVAASDVFSLGCVLYFMLTGAYPFNGDNLLDLAIAVAVDEPVLIDDQPEPARRLLRLLLQKDVDARPANGGEVLETIRELRSGGAKRSTTSSRTTTSARTRSNRRRHRRR